MGKDKLCCAKAGIVLLSQNAQGLKTLKETYQYIDLQSPLYFARQGADAEPPYLHAARTKPSQTPSFLMQALNSLFCAHYPQCTGMTENVAKQRKIQREI